MLRAGTLLLALALSRRARRTGAGCPDRADQGGREVARPGRPVLDGRADARGDPAGRGEGRRRAPRSASRPPIPFTRYEPATYNPAHGKVFFSDGAANYVCSGTALSSGNQSVVWTAGHCVNEGPGGFYTNWAFVPGLQGRRRAVRHVGRREPADHVGVGQQRRLLLRPGRRGRGDERVGPDADERRRQPRDRVQPGRGAALPVARVPGRAAVLRRPHVHLRGRPRHARHVGEPGDDGHRVRHDGRVVRRRLGRRQQRPVGQLVRLQPRSRTSCTGPTRAPSRRTSTPPRRAADGRAPDRPQPRAGRPRAARRGAARRARGRAGLGDARRRGCSSTART